MSDISNGNLLRSWKEISAYLGVDIRTCHRWEANHGMPVHRAEGAETRSPVFAYREELDRWFRDTFKNGRSNHKAGRGRPWLKWALAGAVVLVLIGAYVLFFSKKPARPQPADFHIVGSKLIVVDEAGRELWRKDMKVDNLETEKFYRALFQSVNKSEGNMLPEIIIQDINGDGDTEVLFALRRKRDQTGEGLLFCYDRRGEELWSFQAGREIRCGAQTFSPDYRIAGFLRHDLDGDGRLETIVESFHAPDWPCQLAVLDSAGALIGEFWNSGYLREFTFHDINGDGREEMVACGVNNEYRGGCLAIFDTRRISGSSPQSADFACGGVGPGSMLYYVVTPQNEVSAADGHWVSGFQNIEITKNGWIRATTQDGLIAEFDFGLRCLQVSASNGYKSRHQDFVAAGKIANPLSEAYFEWYRQEIRYWSGTGWSGEPTPVRR